jgi:hypothetical protein
MGNLMYREGMINVGSGISLELPRVASLGKILPRLKS